MNKENVFADAEGTVEPDFYVGSQGHVSKSLSEYDNYIQTETALYDMLGDMSKTQRRKYAAGVGAYDITNGSYKVGLSGTIPDSIEDVVLTQSNKIGGVGSYGVTNNNIVGKCAEFKVVNELISEGRSLENIRFVEALRPALYDKGVKVPFCDNCVEMFFERLK